MATHIRGRQKDALQYDLFCDIYAGAALKVGKYGFPKLKKTNVIPNGEIRSFNYLLSLPDPENYWIHCFCDDYQFERLWGGLDHYIDYIVKAKGFISTDYSLYRDYSDDWLIWNCRRNRSIAYAIQERNATMIPTAGFGPERTWDWCFDGLPHNSTLAITTNGTLDDPEARRLFVGGVDALVYTTHPQALVICGKYPAWIDKKYPDIVIINIPSFGQQWKARCA